MTRIRRMKRERAILKFLDHVLAKSADVQVVVGPVAWQPDGAGKLWYFVVATADAHRQFRCDQLSTDDVDEIESLRRDFILAATTRRPLVIHDTADELYMAKLCEALWPGERITKVREGVEAERARPAVVH